MLYSLIKVLLISLLTEVVMAQKDCFNCLNVAFADHNSPPYAIIEQGQLKSGIIKEIMDEVGKRLDLPIKYIYTSRNRLKYELDDGRLHLVLISSPKWTVNAENYEWSDSLFVEKNVLLQNQNSTQIKVFGDLEGKKIGTILGYFYPSLDSLFTKKKLLRDDGASLEINLKKLRMHRIDVLVDSDILVKYILHKNPSAEFEIKDFLEIDQHAIQARMSPANLLPIEPRKLRKVLNDLRDEGFIQDVLSRYQRSGEN